MDILQTCVPVRSMQLSPYRFLHIRIQVHRVDEMHVREFRCQTGDGCTNIFEPWTKIFPSVSGNENHARRLLRIAGVCVTRLEEVRQGWNVWSMAPSFLQR